MIWQNASFIILRDVMGVNAKLSNALFYDLALHLQEDIKRQEPVAENNGTRPAKFAAYLAFWLRKVKPVSNAFYVSTAQKYGGRPPVYEEIVDINEKLAIRLAFTYLRAFNEMGDLKIHVDGRDRKIRYDKAIFRKEVRDFCHQKLGNDGKDVLETLITDMRYRTFGPHHLEHLFDQFVFRLYSKAGLESEAQANAAD